MVQLDRVALRRNLLEPFHRKSSVEGAQGNIPINRSSCHRPRPAPSRQFSPECGNGRAFADARCDLTFENVRLVAFRSISRRSPRAISAGRADCDNLSVICKAGWQQVGRAERPHAPLAGLHHSPNMRARCRRRAADVEATLARYPHEAIPMGGPTRGRKGLSFQSSGIETTVRAYAPGLSKAGRRLNEKHFSRLATSPRVKRASWREKGKGTSSLCRQTVEMSLRFAPESFSRGTMRSFRTLLPRSIHDSDRRSLARDRPENGRHAHHLPPGDRRRA